MAQQVTISTFLDLKDNLSPGLAKVEAALKRMTQQAALMNGALTRASGTLTPMSRSFSAVNTHLAASVRHANALAAAVRSIRVPPMPPLPPPPPPPPGGGGGLLFGGAIGANVLSYGIVRAAGMAKAAVVDFYDSVIEKGLEYERAISATSSAMFTLGISPSMRVAEAYSKQLYEIIRDLSAKLPGEAKEYVEVFQRTIPQAIMSGATDMRKYADLVSKYSAVAIQRGVSAKIAASNLQIMLKGSAREQTVMASNLAAYTGKSVTELNKLSRAERFEEYAKAIEKAAGGLSAMGDKAETIFGTLRSEIDKIYQIGGQPLFEAAKTGAIELSRWLEQNKKSVMELAGVISTELGNALLGTVTIFTSLLKTVTTVSEKIQSILPAGPVGKVVTQQAKYAAAGPIMGTALRAWDVVTGLGERRKESLAEIARTGPEGEMARRIGLARTYGTLEDKYGMTVKSLGDASALAKESTALIKKGVFKDISKPQETALSEFLEYKGATPEIAQAVHEALLARGVFKLSDVKATETPGGRTTNYQDFRYSRFDINQAFAEGFDPDRIAVAFTTDLARMGEIKTQAMTTQTSYQNGH